MASSTNNVSSTRSASPTSPMSDSSDGSIIASPRNHRTRATSMRMDGIMQDLRVRFTDDTSAFKNAFVSFLRRVDTNIVTKKNVEDLGFARDDLEKIQRVVNQIAFIIKIGEALTEGSEVVSSDLLRTLNSEISEEQRVDLPEPEDGKDRS